MRLLSAIACGLAVLFWSAVAMAGDEVLYGPAPAWVKPVSLPDSDPDATGTVEPLLFSVQEHLGADAHVRYLETAVKILTPQGLGEAGVMHATWDPELMDLTVVKVEIVRNGQVIDLLAAGDRFSVLRRESNLSSAILDGTLTAIFEPRGLRVGDILRFGSMTRTVDPVFGDHRESASAFAELGVRRMYFRQVVPEGSPVRWRATEDYRAKMKQTRTEHGLELEVDLVDFEAPEPPKGAPDRFIIPARLELTDFADWKSLSSKFAEPYATASTLAPDSPVRAEIEKIRAEHAAPEARALAALHLVQQDIRYLALAMGTGGYMPAQADETWTRRFGDCKGKTALLIAILRELGIEAEPALVHSEGGDGMDEMLPRAGHFDHVIVRAEIGGRTYWLDGTRPYDRGLESLSGVPFAFALPVRAAGADLEAIERVPPARPLRETLVETDITGGVEGKVPSRMVAILRGDEGMLVDLALSMATRQQAEDGLKEMFSDDLRWLDVEKIAYGWDEEADGLKVEFTGKGRFNWRRAGADWSVNMTDALNDQFPDRGDGPGSDAPYSLQFPFYYSETARVIVPRGGARKQFIVPDIDETIGGARYRRTGRIEDGLVEATQSVQVLMPEVSAAEARASNRIQANSAIARSAVFTFGSAGVSGRAAAETGELIRLALANAEADNVQEAFSYADRALKIDPTSSRILDLHYSLAVALRRFDVAARDATAMRRLNPTAQAYLAEGQALVSAGKHREALTALNEAEKLRASADLVAAARMAAFAALDRPADLARTLDGLLASDAARDIDLGLVSREIQDKAGSARTRFLRVLEGEPQSAGARLLRGVMHTRDNVDAAIAQYDQALLIRPDFLEALRRRAAAKLTKNDLAGAIDDLERARDVAPDNLVTLSLLAVHYDRAKESEKALSVYDAMVRRQPDSSDAYNNRCWARATRNVEVEQALADCNRSLEIRPDYAAALDSRGLVNIRLGRLDEAIADYDRSLELRQYAGSYYGRGIAKRLKGEMEEGQADIDKALELNPRIGRDFEDYGLTP